MRATGELVQSPTLARVVNRSLSRQTIRRALPALTVVIVGIALTEFALRRALPPREGYFVIAPHTDWTIRITPSVVRGVSEVAHYRINALGIRGRPFGADASEFRMLAVGGSTTECFVLDDTKAWTYLLERTLGRTTDGRHVWVGNVGKSGLTAREHVLHLKYLLPQYPRTDAVLALVGVNDMLGALKQGARYELPVPVTTPEGERRDLRRAFAVFPNMQYLPPPGNDPTVSWYRASAIWDVARRAKLRWNLRRSFAIDAQEGLVRARAHRNGTRLIDSLPSLSTPLIEYRRNLHAMADIASSRHARMIFVTQPSVWRDAMPAAEERNLWLGWLGTDWQTSASSYSARALARAMERFNTVTLEVCRERAVECVDAASAIAMPVGAVASA